MAESARAALVGVEPISVFRHFFAVHLWPINTIGVEAD